MYVYVYIKYKLLLKSKSAITYFDPKFKYYNRNDYLIFFLTSDGAVCGFANQFYLYFLIFFKTFLIICSKIEKIICFLCMSTKILTFYRHFLKKAVTSSKI